ncbi:MAG: ADP-ribosylation factor family protein [Promethearchaeota archaeon]
MEKGKSALNKGDSQEALSNLNMAQKTLADMAAKGVAMKDEDIQELESLIIRATQDSGPKESLSSTLSRLRDSATESDKKKEKIMSIFLFGLDAAGKTTLVDYINNEKFEDHAPTVGVNISRVTLGNIKFVFNDVGGQQAYRTNWNNYWRNPDFMIFMVDSSDSVRFDAARDYLWEVLNHPDAAGVPLLILSNKIDKAESKSLAEVSDALNTAGINDRMYAIFDLSVKDAIHINNALNFIASQALEDDDFRKFVGKKVDAMNRNYTELANIYLKEAEMHEENRKFDKALARVHKSKLILEELFKQGFSKTQKLIVKCNVWLSRLNKKV